ncbi:type I polyketide synthase [Actinacidiphila yeochonensis]|uniref:type I polyketide synthase n=1 Tax=Actinacidiphila yeochonensis TaxID=89050 RepID=UPI00068CEA32|nr:type I polyketide synthase [Actinacidiphila yeochonensis]
MTTAPDQRTLLEQALRQLREARTRLAAAERGRPEPLAVIGAAVRAPGGVADLDTLWERLRAGTDAVTPWHADPSGRRAGGDGSATGRWAGQLDQVDGFDADFFGISGDEADHMDPQQRLVLETAWEAAEDAGLPLERLRERPTGVFLGMYGADYLTMQFAGQAGINAFTAPGGAHSIAANRVSYLLDLRGPSLVVDTACSSSLVALHLAARALRAGDCDLALVGGVNVILGEAAMAATEKVLPMASGGRCRSFDAGADGIVRSEGCGVLLLQRAADARADGRRVRALVRGTAVNHNGRTNGLTAPSPRAQAELLRRALADGAADPADVVYVEAHGTGTHLGDPIEAEAVREVYGAGPVPCAIGSAKSNFGHQEAAAGVVGLLKAMLVLDRGEVPPGLHLDELNPEVDLGGSRLSVPTVLTPLAAPPEGRPPLAAVSSFGFGGANAHVVLQAPELPVGEGAEEAAENVPEGGLLLPLSARSAGALAELVGAYAGLLNGSSPREAARLCAAAAAGRSHHRFRLCATAPDPAALAAELRSVWTDFLRPVATGRRIGFVFSGQGTQWAGMGRDLLAEPVVRAEAERCDAVVRELAGWSVLEELRSTGPGRLGRTDVAQVCIAVLQLGLAALWSSWGVRPTAVAGHSMGEIVAACHSGALDRRQAFDLILTRARVIEEGARGGAMSGLALPAAEAAEVVERALAEGGGRLGVAAVNSPHSTVVAGDPRLVERAEALAARRGARFRRLAVEYAFHSPLLDGRDAELSAAVKHVTPVPGRLAHYSTVTGDRVRAADLTPEHWGRNLRDAVLFADAAAAMARDGVTVLVEVGPHPVLLRDIAATLDGVPHTAVGSLRRDTAGRTALNASLAELYRAGTDLDWAAVSPPRGPAALPLYPWQRRRHWLRLRAAAPTPGADLAADDTPDAAPVPDAPALAALPAAELEETLVGYVRAQLADSLDLEGPGRVRADSTFDSLGLSSLMIVELKNRVERDFAVAVPLQALLEGGTPRGLARAVAGSLTAGAAPPHGSRTGPGTTDDSGA